MTFFEAVFLGILQGITEFLPISSTGHLILAGKFMNLISDRNTEQWTAFIAVLQLGTLLAVLIYFRRDIINIISDFFNDNIRNPKKIKNQSLNSRLGWIIIVGSIPVGIAGVFFKDIIEGSLTKNLYVIAVSLIALAVLLYIAEKTANHKKDMNQVTFLDAIFIGLAQALALIPGSSRSGTTITGGLFAGLKRETAARFSFLLSIPAVLASGLFEFYNSLRFINKEYLIDLSVASIMAGIAGYLSIGFLLKFLERQTTLIFVLYRILLGAVILILLYNNVVEP